MLRSRLNVTEQKLSRLDFNELTATVASTIRRTIENLNTIKTNKCLNYIE